MAGFQLGNVVGLLLSPILMSQGGIYGPFVIFGLSGFLWLLVWLSATSSAPDQHPQITKSELEYIKQKQQTSTRQNKRNTTGVIPPFRRLLSKMPTWAVIVANSMHSWVCINIPLNSTLSILLLGGFLVEVKLLAPTAVTYSYDLVFSYLVKFI